MERTLTEAEFEAEFQPVMQPDGSHQLPLNYSPAYLDTLLAVGRLWTAVEMDGQWAYLSGMHHVNREYYIECRVPYPEDADLTVECEHLNYCDACGALLPGNDPTAECEWVDEHEEDDTDD